MPTQPVSTGGDSSSNSDRIVRRSLRLSQRQRSSSGGDRRNRQKKTTVSSGDDDDDDDETTNSTRGRRRRKRSRRQEPASSSSSSSSSSLTDQNSEDQDGHKAAITGHRWCPSSSSSSSSVFGDDPDHVLIKWIACGSARSACLGMSEQQIQTAVKESAREESHQRDTVGEFDEEELTRDDVLPTWTDLCIESSGNHDFFNSMSMLSIGRMHSLLLTESGEVYVSGDNSCGQLGLRRTLVDSVQCYTRLPLVRRVRRVVAHGCNSFLIVEKGTVFVMGDNACGALGLPCTTRLVDTPTAVLYSSSAPDFDQLQFEHVICGDTHTFFATRDYDRIFYCGDVRDWRCGVPCSSKPEFTKSPVELPVDRNEFGHIVKIACGSYHTVMLNNRGGVIVTGSNFYCQIGSDRERHARGLQRMEDDLVRSQFIVDVSCGMFHTVMLTREGIPIVCGLISIDSADGVARPTPPTTIHLPIPMTRIAEGNGHAHTAIFSHDSQQVIMTTGTLNNVYQLGNGDTKDLSPHMFRPNHDISTLKSDVRPWRIRQVVMGAQTNVAILECRTQTDRWRKRMHMMNQSGQYVDLDIACQESTTRQDQT